MTTNLNAALPHVHAAVRASAGTGKTWLLVTRLVHLLLAGVPPRSILAITFTRKAAAEMQARLLQRLYELAACPDESLDAALAGMGIAAGAGAGETARRLYERLLAGDESVQVTTFHAFCQSILRRFPLEADVPPGFEVAEDTGLLEEAAWDALFAEATRQPDAAVGLALEELFARCGGLGGAQEVLNAFLQRRSDWLAYTQEAADPVAWATDRLRGHLDIAPGPAPAERFFTPQNGALLEEFRGLLLRHDTAGNRDCADHLAAAADTGTAAEQRLARARAAFFTQAGTPRARKPSQAQARSLGAAGQDRLLTLHTLLCDRLEAARLAQCRLDTFGLSAAWYTAGARLLHHYQDIKQARRMLDFGDLEWSAYRLLTRAAYMQWVQYKLDQAVEHVLIDEFQDTNPTQWHLIRPLLEELAAGDDGRGRSVFIVGDEKQSIYRFRRAEPRLFDAAVDWIAALPDAVVQPLDASWRSAPAVIDFVNRVFDAGPLGDRLPRFARHDTHRKSLWGRVEVHPPVARPPAAAPAPGGDLRDPLQSPRPAGPAAGHYLEGRAIASRIQALIHDTTPVGTDGEARPLAYADIAILVRDRSHAEHYETALRDAGIPYLGISRGSLLDSQEVRDLLALLRVLAAPYDTLALATVLRSPLFDCSDEELMQLAAAGETAGGSWSERLAVVAAALPATSPLARAARWLQAWRDAAAAIPVHDLLDRVYCEGDVFARFEAAFPPHLRGRVRSNLTRLIELALEVDSGRYPSLSRFLAVLDNLRSRGRDAPDERPPPGLDAVSLLTVHAAKGLEWPVVFLADAAWSRADRRSWHPLVAWPPEERRPAQFYITGKAADMDDLSAACHAGDQAAQQREEANLLYVALTRARQILIITGCAPARRGDPSWLDMIAAQVAPQGLSEAWILESGTPPACTAAAPPDAPAPPDDPRLRAPLRDAPPAAEVNPSRSGGGEEDPGTDGGAPDAAAARRRGVAIHRMLELLSGGTVPPGDQPPPQVMDGLSPESDIAAWWREACRVVTNPQWGHLFDPRRHAWARNEVPISYRHGDAQVHGVIDRLVDCGGELLVIDYKTHADADAGQAAALATGYRAAMQLYRRGVERLWPGRPVRVLLLFTACGELIELPSEA